MKLDFLEVENFRSYAKTSVGFSEGVTLFEGDVGSGKSSLLYAIEFALFGLGDLKASHLLRHGSHSGFVKLGLEIEGKNCVIFRRLERKGEGAGQTPGWIEEDGLRSEYSPEELKQKVLQLLQFRENPAAKATSWIFRYAIFTPQEQMKEILLLRSEERLQTLRKAFGMEEYKTAQEHAVVLQRVLREDSKALEGELRDLTQWLEKKEQLQNQQEELVKKLTESRNALSLIIKTLEETEKELQKAREEHSVLERIGAELPLLRKRRNELEREKNRLEDELRTVGAKLAKLKEEEEKLAKTIRPLAQGAEVAWEKAEAEVRNLQVELGAAEHRVREHSSLKTGVCPTCGQRLSKDLHERIQAAENGLEKVKKQLAEAVEREREARKQVEAVREQGFLRERLDNVRDQAKAFAEIVADLRKNSNETSNQLDSADIEWMKKQEAFSRWSVAAKRLEEAEQKTREKQRSLQQALHQQGSLEAAEKHIAEALAEANARIENKRALQEKLKNVQEKQTWLEEHFVPSVQNIEHHVLQRINDEFNALFAKWFAQLLETQDLEAEVDASFTPVIRQQGYEQDYAALSGGEKSALALAYRLALNTLVRQTTPSLKNNLLILDEPTDGFSKEQLGRMRAVLNDVGAQQILLVSHERELEAFCDKVFSVEKQHGESKVKEL